jgi:hypothetical protein
MKYGFAHVTVALIVNILIIIIKISLQKHRSQSQQKTMNKISNINVCSTLHNNSNVNVNSPPKELPLLQNHSDSLHSLLQLRIGNSDMPSHHATLKDEETGEEEPQTEKLTNVVFGRVETHEQQYATFPTTVALSTSQPILTVAFTPLSTYVGDDETPEDTTTISPQGNGRLN